MLRRMRLTSLILKLGTSSCLNSYLISLKGLLLTSSTIFPFKLLPVLNFACREPDRHTFCTCGPFAFLLSRVVLYYFTHNSSNNNLHAQAGKLNKNVQILNELFQIKICSLKTFHCVFFFVFLGRVFDLITFKNENRKSCKLMRVSASCLSRFTQALPGPLTDSLVTLIPLYRCFILK